MKIYKVTAWVDDGCKKYETTENVVAPNAEIASSTYKAYLQAAYDTTAEIVKVTEFQFEEGDVSILGRKKTLESLERRKA